MEKRGKGAGQAHGPPDALPRQGFPAASRAAFSPLLSNWCVSLRLPRPCAQVGSLGSQLSALNFLPPALPATSSPPRSAPPASHPTGNPGTSPHSFGASSQPPAIIAPAASSAPFAGKYTGRSPRCGTCPLATYRLFGPSLLGNTSTAFCGSPSRAAVIATTGSSQPQIFLSPSHDFSTASSVRPTPTHQRSGPSDCAATPPPAGHTSPPPPSTIQIASTQKNYFASLHTPSPGTPKPLVRLTPLLRCFSVPLW